MVFQAALDNGQHVVLQPDPTFHIKLPQQAKEQIVADAADFQRDPVPKLYLLVLNSIPSLQLPEGKKLEAASIIHLAAVMKRSGIRILLPKYMVNHGLNILPVRQR